ncbi:Protein argonaute-3 [Geodia barretti]|nr:Protein argonaute-3 [Geodia barretti]
MVTVTGRILPPPLLQYGGKVQARIQAQPERGVWDMRGKQFHRGVEIHCWALAVFAQYRLCPEEKLQSVIPTPLSPSLSLSHPLSYALLYPSFLCHPLYSFTPFFPLVFTYTSLSSAAGILYSNCVASAAMPVSTKITVYSV